MQTDNNIISGWTWCYYWRNSDIKKISSFYQLGCRIFFLIPDILTHSSKYTCTIPPRNSFVSKFSILYCIQICLNWGFFSHKIGILPSLLNLGPKRNHRALVHRRQLLQWQTPQTTSFVFSFTSFEFRPVDFIMFSQIISLKFTIY